jgi:hypothetical protein
MTTIKHLYECVISFYFLTAVLTNLLRIEKTSLNQYYRYLGITDIETFAVQRGGSLSTADKSVLCEKYNI